MVFFIFYLNSYALQEIKKINIVLDDHSRVVLDTQGGEKSDYIHANYIEVSNTVYNLHIIFANFDPVVSGLIKNSTYFNVSILFIQTQLCPANSKQGEIVCKCKGECYMGQKFHGAKYILWLRW